MGEGNKGDHTPVSAKKGGKSAKEGTKRGPSISGATPGEF